MEENAKKQMEEYLKKIDLQRKEIRKRIIGMPQFIESLFICFYTFSERKSVSHLLVEGKVGKGKTAALEAFAQTITGAAFSRIQFTPDLKPIDLVRIVEQCQDRSLIFHDGPIFANLVLADEINRADEKTRAGLLEAMAEEQVTIGKKTIKLDKPFFVMATENPSEAEGVFRLGAAQSDRFMMKIYVEPLSKEEEMRVIRIHLEKGPEIKQVITKEEVLGIREFIRENIFLSPKIEEGIVDLVRALRPGGGLVESKDFYLLPESERADIYLAKAAMARAFLRSRSHVVPADVECLAFPVIHHRMEFKHPEDDFQSRKVISQAVKKVIEDGAKAV